MWLRVAVVLAALCNLGGDAHQHRWAVVGGGAASAAPRMGLMRLRGGIDVNVGAIPGAVLPLPLLMPPSQLLFTIPAQKGTRSCAGDGAYPPPPCLADQAEMLLRGSIDFNSGTTPAPHTHSPRTLGCVGLCISYTATMPANEHERSVRRYAWVADARPSDPLDQPDADEMGICHVPAPHHPTNIFATTSPAAALQTGFASVVKVFAWTTEPHFSQ